MQYYADRTYIHSKLHGIKTTLLTAREYADIINSDRIENAFPDYIQTGRDMDYASLKETIFRTQISHVINLVSASKPYIKLFRAFLRLYESKNISTLNIFKNHKRRSIWYDISPYNTLSDLGEESKTEKSNISFILRMFPELEKKAGVLESIQEPDSIDAFLGFYSWFSFIKILSPGLFTQRSNAARLILINCLRERSILKQRLMENYGFDHKEAESYLMEETGLLNKIIKRFRVDEEAAESTTAASYEKEIIAHNMNLFTQMSKMFYRDFHSTDTVVCYLILLKFQIRNLFYITDCFRLNMPKKQIHENIFSGE